MKVRKQLSFDLDTNVLKEMFGGEKYTKAYSDIKSFMKKNDCVHIEGSVYMSNRTMSNLEVLNLLADLKEQYPYMTKCVRAIHQANISNIHSLNAEFEYDGTPGKFAAADLKQQKENIPDKTSVLARLKDKQEEAKAYNNGHNAAQLENKKER